MVAVTLSIFEKFTQDYIPTTGDNSTIDSRVEGQGLETQLTHTVLCTILYSAYGMSIRVRNLALYEGVDHGLHIQYSVVELDSHGGESFRKDKPLWNQQIESRPQPSPESHNKVS